MVSLGWEKLTWPQFLGLGAEDAGTVLWDSARILFGRTTSMDFSYKFDYDNLSAGLVSTLPSFQSQLHPPRFRARRLGHSFH